MFDVMKIYFALTGLCSLFSNQSRGVAPGYYISRLQRENLPLILTLDHGSVLHHEHHVLKRLDLFQIKLDTTPSPVRPVRNECVRAAGLP